MSTFILFNNTVRWQIKFKEEKMKRSNKTLSLAIALIFLFSAVTPAFASQATSGGTLAALGVIDGDPSGNLNLDSTITRAEMCVVLARLAGMENAADVLADVPSAFSDVKNDAWYTGWINLASQQGWVAGYPDGTFKPSGNVTYAEALAMILNVLGYEAEGLSGAWPYNYLVKAAELGLADDVDFSANDAAVRGDIFIIVEAALYEDFVYLDKDTDVSGIFVKTTEDGENPLERMGYEVWDDAFIQDADILLGDATGRAEAYVDGGGWLAVAEGLDIYPFVGVTSNLVIDGEEIIGAIQTVDVQTAATDIVFDEDAEELRLFYGNGDDDYYLINMDAEVYLDITAGMSTEIFALVSLMDTWDFEDFWKDVWYVLNEDD